jgi:hypothetical protein
MDFRKGLKRAEREDNAIRGKRTESKKGKLYNITFMIVCGITYILTKCGLVTSVGGVLKFFKFPKFYPLDMKVSVCEQINVYMCVSYFLIFCDLTKF